MAEANKGRKVGEGARFLKVVIECLKCELLRSPCRAQLSRGASGLVREDGPG